jgi:hypothetical protein
MFAKQIETVDELPLAGTSTNKCRSGQEVHRRLLHHLWTKLFPADAAAVVCSVHQR